MSLRTKFFYSHLVVMLISIITVAVMAGIISIVSFDEISNDVIETSRLPNSEFMYIIAEEESGTISTDTALNISLLIGLSSAIIMSTIIAFFLSMLLSRRMALPIHEMIKVTQRISDGHYNQRISYNSEDEIGELAGHFNDMAESLDNVESLRRQLLADLTHELNTPLSGIIASIEGIQDGTLPIESSYSVIHDEALRLQRLVRDVQYLSSVEATIYSLNREHVCVVDLLRSVSNKLQIQYESKVIQLIIKYPPSSLKVWADSDRITQVFINLLGNALQYTADGGQVCVSYRIDMDKVEFIITDTGIGMAQSDLKQIFNRFYRVEKSRNRRMGGSGIGLTIAQYIVEAHEGYIWAESEGLGQGSQFHFTLPIAS